MTTRSKKKVTKKKTTRKKPTAKKKQGRPTKYDPAFCEMVIEKMAEGYSKEAVAGYLEISKDTLYQWEKKHKDFSDAISIGEAKSRLFWEGSMVKHHIHTKNGKQINGQVFNLNMKNRFGWSDKKEIKEEQVDKTKKTFAFSLDEEPATDDE